MSVLRGIGKRFGQTAEREPRMLLSIFVLVYLVVTAGMAMRPFWYDELFTYHMSRLPDMTSIWGALKDGADLNPPILYIATRAAHAVFGFSELATRLPAIAGFLVMCLCIYRFVANRCPRSYGFAAMLVPVMTAGYRYASEARAYGLEFGFVGIALLAWQRATQPGRRTWHLLALYFALAAALFTHCYAVLAVFPFVAGELARDLKLKKIDWPVWICFAGLAPILLTYLPLLAASKHYVVENPIFAPTLLSVPMFFGVLLHKAIWPIGAALILVSLRPSSEQQTSSEIPSHEIVCGAAFVAIPVLTFLLAWGLTGMFMERYAMASMIGVGILVAFGLCQRTRGNQEFGGMIAVLFIASILCFSGGGIVGALANSSPSASLNLATTLPELPFVVSNGLMFLEADHYAKPELAARSHFLIDEAAGLKYTHCTMFDRGYVAMRKWFPMRGKVEQYKDFVSQNPSFVVYGSYDHPMDWLIRRLTDEGYHLTLLGNQAGPYGNALLLKAERP